MTRSQAAAVYVGTDDNRATGDGRVDWYRVGTEQYGLTDVGVLLDADGCPVPEGGQRNAIVNAIRRSIAPMPDVEPHA